MNNTLKAFFFETQQISEDSLIFEQLKKQELFFSDFQVNRKYYLFFYRQTYIDIDLIEPHIQIIQELDRKQRQVRSFRGFFLYGLEIIESGKIFEMLINSENSLDFGSIRRVAKRNI